MLLSPSRFVGLLVWASLLCPAFGVQAQSNTEREGAILDQENQILDQRRHETARKEAAARARQDADRAQKERERAEQARQQEAASRAQRETETLNALDTAAQTLAGRLTGRSPFQVVKASPPNVIVRGGTDAAIVRGTKMYCFSRGEALVVDGEKLDAEEKHVGDGPVDEVREKVSYVQLGDVAPSLKEGDVCYTAAPDYGKVAIMPLLHDSQRSRLGENLGERFYQAASARGMTLVERGQLTRIIAEQKLGDSALFDAKSAAHVGQLAGAESVLLGSIDDASGSILLAIRVVRSSDALVLKAQEVTLPKNEVSLALLQEPASSPDATVNKAQQAAADVSLDNPAAKARDKISRADALLEAGDLVGASIAFREAVDLSPTAPEVVAFATRLRAAPARDAKQYLAKSDALLSLGDRAGAEEATRQALALAPDLPEAKEMSAKIKIASGEASTAKAQAELTRANALIDAGDFEGAGRALHTALDTEPNLPQARLVATKLKKAPVRDAKQALARADALVAAGMLEEASEAFVDAVQRNPELPDAKAVGTRLADLRSKSSEANLGTLIAQRQKSAHELLEAGDTAGADRMLAIAQVLSPDDPRTQALAADLKAKRGETRTLEMIYRISGSAPTIE